MGASVRALLFSLAIAGAARGGVLDVELKCGAARCEPRGTLVLQSIGDSSLVRRIPIGADARLEEAAGSEWELTLHASGYWASPRRVTFPAEATRQALTVEVWRTGRLRVTVAAADTNVSELRAVVSSPPQLRAAPAIAAGTTFECTKLERGEWTCELPATALDVALRIPGFVPHYRWGANVPSGKAIDLGSVSFERGASLVAWLDGAVAKRLEHPARAVLRRHTSPDASATAVRLAEPVAEATFTKRGAVQLGPLAPGEYVLETRAEGFAVSRLAVEVYEGRESVLKRPISLSPAVTARIRLSPPLGPGERPWHVDLWRPVNFGSGWERAGGGEVSPDGFFVAPDQAEGPVRVGVLDPLRNRFASRELMISSGDGEHLISLDVIAVTGSVSFEGEPLPSCTLAFGGTGGAEKVRAVTTSAGEFRVALPRRGKWLVDAEAPDAGVAANVEVTIEDGDESLDIELPSTEIAGSVTDSRGAPAAAAEVSLLAAAGPLKRVTDAAGTFVFRGVRAGSARLRAIYSATAASSSVVEVIVPEEGKVEQVHLILNERRGFSGVVLSNGRPVAGARVNAYAFVGDAAQQEKATTDLEGRFAFDLPENTRELALVVGVPGRTLQAFSVPPRQEQVVLESASTGGTISLRWTDGAKRLLVRFNGTLLPMHDLFNWARAHGARPENSAVTVPNLAAGRYQFCADAICVEGALAIGGTLGLDAR